MKILILSSNLSNEAGGYAESSFLLRERLSEIKNTEVHLFGFWKSRFLKLNYELNDKISIFLPGIIKKFPFSLNYFRKILKIKPDIIDIQGLWSSSSFFNLLNYFIFKTPYIITPRGMLEKWALKQSYLKKKFFYHLVEKYHLKYASYLRATSELEAKTLKNLGFKNIIMIPNSIKVPNKIRKKIKKNKIKKLLFLSRFHPKKGISELLITWKKIQDNYKDWELIICGYDEDNYKKLIKENIRNLKLKRVKVKEFLVGKKKNNLFQSADLFILLSHSENFGLVIAESLAHAVPVITTKNTPWKNLNKYKCGWCIDLKINKVVTTLKLAIDLDPKQKKNMGLRGRNWILKEFSDQNIGNRMFSVYKRILKNKL